MIGISLFGDIHVRVSSMIYFLNNMFTLNAFYWRALSVNILVYILLFSINLNFTHVFSL